MANVKKIPLALLFFVISLTFLTLCACQPKHNTLYKVSGRQLKTNNNYSDNEEIEKIISPYRTHINNDLDSVLAYNPTTQDKSRGKWETNIGNLLAKSTFELSSLLFFQRENKNIDFCLLNHGGIRAIIPQGNVTTRTAYEIMPFENNVVVIGLNSKKVKQLAQFILQEKKPHPLFGITIFTDTTASKIEKIEINGKPITEDTVYYVVTSDYLANGGDNMTFFQNSSIRYELDYKLRNLFIDYFKKTDTIPNITEKHIIIR